MKLLLNLLLFNRFPTPPCNSDIAFMTPELVILPLEVVLLSLFSGNGCLPSGCFCPHIGHTHIPSRLGFTFNLVFFLVSSFGLIYVSDFNWYFFCLPIYIPSTFWFFLVYWTSFSSDFFTYFCLSSFSSDFLIFNSLSLSSFSSDFFTYFSLTSDFFDYFD